MRNLSILFLSAALTLGTFSIVTYSSCKIDKCKDIACLNAGTCAEGICTCTTGYEGAKCETKVLAKYEGSYSAEENCDMVGASSKTASITIDPSDLTILRLKNFSFLTCGNDAFLPVKVNGTSLSIDADVCGLIYTGSGSIATVNGKYVLTITYEIKVTSGGTTVSYGNCTLVLTKL